MKRNRFLFFLSAFAFYLVFYQGCAAPVLDEQETSLSGERLINRLEANRRKIKSFEAKGTIHVTAGQFDNSAQFRVVLRRPDSLYIEIFGPFGLELAQMLITPKRYMFYEALNNVAYTGNASEDLFKNVFRLDLPFDNIFSALCDVFTGTVNLSNRLYVEPSFFDRIQDKYLITFRDSLSGSSTKYEIAANNLSILTVKEILPSQSILLESEYTAHQKYENALIPLNITVRYPKGGQTVAIEYTSVTVNAAASVIDFQVPEDADIITW